MQPASMSNTTEIRVYCGPADTLCKKPGDEQGFCGGVGYNDICPVARAFIEGVIKPEGGDVFRITTSTKSVVLQLKNRVNSTDITGASVVEGKQTVIRTDS